MVKQGDIINIDFDPVKLEEGVSCMDTAGRMQDN